MAIQAQKFWSKADTRGDCWWWPGCKYENRYGSFKVDGRAVVASRVAWELANGPIPAGMRVLHTCGHKGCVNPDHLQLNVSHTAKLLAEDIPVIRSQLALGVSQNKLAKDYGVKKQTISLINNNLIWKNVQ